MIQLIAVDDTFTLEDYESFASLAPAVRELRARAAELVPSLRGRPVWMVNSTAQGGGVAEMMPKMVSIMNELGVDCRWAVIHADDPEFFLLTKRLHNLIHGQGETGIGRKARAAYEAVCEENARSFLRHLSPRDLVVVHDPQPMGMARHLDRAAGIRTVWRCHIGLDRATPETKEAWEFLRPYAGDYDLAVFSAPEYVPSFFSDRAHVIHPAIDPYSHKNRELSPHKLVGILCNASIKTQRHPVLTPPFVRPAMRYLPDGRFAPASDHEEIGLLYRPIVTQVSRWDRLKGYRPLMKAFVRLKDRTRGNNADKRHRRRREIVRLVLAGPSPEAIQDDPEGRGVLEELCRLYRELPPTVQSDVALLTLPMESRKENALMVNALQRCSTVVVQNSLQEGFGLTATEAMWKRKAFLGSRACGIRQQVRDGRDGVLVENAEDPAEIARSLDALLADEKGRDLMGRSGERRVQENFLVFTQVHRWLQVLARATDLPGRPIRRALT